MKVHRYDQEKLQVMVARKPVMLVWDMCVVKVAVDTPAAVPVAGSKSVVEEM